MNNNTIKTWIMAGGLAISIFAGAASAQIIGGDVEVDGSSQDVVFLGGEMEIRGQIDGDIKGVAGSVRVDANVTGSVQLFGGELEVQGAVGHDLDLAGGEVRSSANVAGDANFAGGETSVSGSVGGMLNAASGHVRIESQVGGDAKLAGGYIETGDDSRFAGTAEIVGGEVFLGGQFVGPVGIEGGEISLSGVFLGDVEILAEEVYVLDGTQVTGELRIRSPHEPVIADDTSFGGYDYEERAFNFGAKDWEHIDFDLDAPTGIFGLFIPGAVFLMAAITLLLAPSGVASVVSRFRSSPVVGGFLGFIGFALSPIVLIILTILLAITVVGILLIPIMWLIFWPFMLLCMAFGAIAIGDMAFNRKPDEKTLDLGMRLLSTFAVVAVFAAFGAVGGLGFVIGFILLFVGLGSWLMALGRRREPETPIPAPGLG